ncbi:hypothetical protein [Sphingomonas psychrotolerans]|uniref:Uncharacterized protein n=1 Tax=Sphingomonas psychrotolerans TaxID=1327635 RepID=A0A2K8MFE6_9SPHN|nr:hypothetical protein [Sphingomonas psychrotolerans]ATY32595.1 hypothetical protein CVN68_11945 [Sphingomonas psychrotolerans]
MDRRLFLAATLGTFAAPRAVAQTAPITRWKVTSSEGHDAIAFLGPLSGEALYQKFYAEDAKAFPLPDPVRSEIAALWKEAGTSGFGLLGPVLSSKISGTDVSTLDAVIAALADPETRIRPSLRQSPYWDEAEWKWLAANAPRLVAVFTAMRDADFPGFRNARSGEIASRIPQLQRDLAPFDVVRLQQKLTGRSFSPEIEVVLLQFCKPHGIKVQGQTFLQAADWNLAITVRNAAHEMLHPPILMDGAVAKAALAVLARDPLIPRIVREHDPKWGYTSLDGYLNEDMVQALDQLISERLGVARNPADRWRDNDDGIHVLAAGLYGMLRQDRWSDTGGAIEAWLDRATRTGRLSPTNLHSVAARILERPMDRLWPL